MNKEERIGQTEQTRGQRYKAFNKQVVELPPVPPGFA